MGLIIDKLLGPMIHDHDSDYVNTDGDTMTGDLAMGTNAIKMTDSNGVVWDLTINTDGSLQTDLSITPSQGEPFGPWLWLTYAQDI